jgi:putative transposase
MKTERLNYPVKVMSRVLEVSRSGFYAWLKRKPSCRKQENAKLEVAIRAEHKVSRETYGPLRLQKSLKAKGFRAGRDRIGRLRKEMGLSCRQKRKFKATTDSKHSRPVFQNLLNQDFDAYMPNQVWLSDITYIATGEGWLYLAGVLDSFNSEMVGYRLSSRMNDDIVVNALDMAIKRRRPTRGTIIHSDRGVQYCSRRYRRRLKKLGFIGSMSEKGNCYDNAMMESLWGLIKTELVYHCHFRTRAEAIEAITEYLEVWYNRQRRHSKLCYLSPAEFLRNYYIAAQAAA